jgi:hypothetical protein
MERKKNTENREEAIKHVTDIVSSPFESGNMSVLFQHAGFVHNHGNEPWFNILESGLRKSAGRG